MARQIAYGVIPMLMVLSVGGAALGQRMQTLKTEKAAQRHCPADTVVWANTSSANYDVKGDPWYGRTRRGIYACKVEAEKRWPARMDKSPLTLRSAQFPGAPA